MNVPLGITRSESFYLLQRRMLAFSKKEKEQPDYSIRKTRTLCILRLVDADVPENFIAQPSGHKSKETLLSFFFFKSASLKQLRRMFLTLSRVDCSRSGDETQVYRHNQDLEVATRSTAEIATSTTENSFIDQSNVRSFTVFDGSSFCGCKYSIHRDQDLHVSIMK